MPEISLSAYLWKKTIHRTLAWLVALFIFAVLSYSVLIYRARSSELDQVLALSSNVVEESLEASDWSLVTNYFQFLSTRGYFNLSLSQQSSKIQYLGPIGRPSFGLGNICLTKETSVAMSVSGCTRIFSAQELSLVGALLLLLIGFSIGIFLLFRSSIGIVFTKISQELESLSSDEALKPISQAQQITQIKIIREKLLSLIAMRSKVAEAQALHKLSRQVAHDIRAPLAYLKFIAKRGTQLNMNPDLEAGLNQTVQRLTQITSELLRDGNPTFFSQEALNIEKLFNNVVEESRSQMKNGIIENQLPKEYFKNFSQSGTTPTIFLRIISNLLSNAIDATHVMRGNTEGPEPKIIIAGEGQWNGVTTLSIQDNGVGLSSELIDQLKYSNVTHAKPNGHGLGLSYVRESMTQFGGSLKIESLPKLGAKVTLTFICQLTPNLNEEKRTENTLGWT